MIDKKNIVLNFYSLSMIVQKLMLIDSFMTTTRIIVIIDIFYHSHKAS